MTAVTQDVIVITETFNYSNNKTTEAVVQRYSTRKYILQKLAKFALKFAGDSFLKMLHTELATLLKKRLAQSLSYEFCEIVKNKNLCFVEHL